MFHVALYRPEIPPNTGNVMRLCANSGATLHLIGPLGFSLDDARLRRAGLDYREWADVRRHDSFHEWVSSAAPGRVLALSRNGAQRHTDAAYRSGDGLLFGPESDGLPDEILQADEVDEVLRIPMRRQSRSLNLANAVAVVLYEALRQHDYPGLV